MTAMQLVVCDANVDIDLVNDRAILTLDENSVVT